MSELTVSVVGPLTVSRDNTMLAASAVGSRKSRTLLGLLAVHGGRRVAGMDRIIDVLWGGTPPRHPEQDTATLVSRLRTALGSEAVVGDRSGYRLGRHIRVDIHEASRLVRRAEAADDPAAARRALDLLEHGDVLEDQPDAEWAEAARRHRAELCRRSRHVVATAALRAGNLRDARAAAEAALAEDPLDEAACRTLMRTHQAAGEPARSLMAFERLRRLLATELGVKPVAATRDLHLAVLRGT